MEHTEPRISSLSKDAKIRSTVTRLALVVMLSLAISLVGTEQSRAASLNPGDFIVIDTGASAVIHVDRDTGVHTTISSGGSFVSLTGVAIDINGDLIVADQVVPAIFRVDPVTGAQTIISSGGSFLNPQRIAIDASGDIIVPNSGTGGADAVIRVDPITGAQTVISSGGNFRDPVTVAIDGTGDLIVTDTTADAIIRVDPITGAQTPIVGPGSSFPNLFGIAIDASGDLIVTDGIALAVIRVNPDTSIITPITSGGLIGGADGVAIDINGDLIIVDNQNGSNGLIRVDPATGVQTLILTAGSFVSPVVVAIVKGGPVLPCACTSFDPPLADGPVTVKKNRVLPLRAQLFDEDGFVITDMDIGSPPVIQITFDSGMGSATDVTDDALNAGVGTEGNQFEYDPITEKWGFNLKTKNYTAAGSYIIKMVSGNAVEYTVDSALVAVFVVE